MLKIMTNDKCPNRKQPKKFLDTQEAYTSHTCFIDGIECFADEARFGGIVIQTV